MAVFAPASNPLEALILDFSAVLHSAILCEQRRAAAEATLRDLPRIPALADAAGTPVQIGGR